MARGPRHSPLPPPLEMECLSALWELKEGTVRDVAAAISPRHSFAYTTVMTLLERLVRRGHLARRKAGRSFVYSPTRDPEELRRQALLEFVANYFGGSETALRQWLDGNPSPQPAADSSEPVSIDTALL